ncbi:MAG: MFS transporter [Burkholderiales bacterium]|nr:MFS transporter [Burkholderiales bacterium]
MSATTDPTSHSQFALLGARRFAPFFWTQFLGAMNDNVFKNGMIIFMAFGGMTLAGMDSNLLVNAAGAVFILPFVLFSAFAGQLADKYEKTRVIRGVKIFEIVVMALGAVGFVTANLAILFIALFAMGLHSTLFGPVKYAILPQTLHQDELVGGNGLVESGTFVAILIGTIAGGVLVAMKPSGPVIVAAATIVLAVIGYVVSRAVPLAPATDPSLKLNWNPFTETAANLRLAAKNIVVWRSMLGISWLWFYGAMLLNQFANMSKDVLGGNEQVATALLAVFAVGVAVGSLLCERLSGKKVEIGLVPFGSIGMSLFAIDLYFASKGLKPVGQSGVADFISKPEHWRVIADLFLLSVSGGLYSVPLYALIQERADPSHRSRIIAANNILNAIFMVVSALLAIVLIKFAHFSVPELILTIGILNAVVAAYIYTLTPEFLLRFLCWVLISFAYRLRVKGLENIPDKGPVIVVANHVSYVDALVITAACRRPIQFVMDHNIFKTPVLGWAFRQMKAIPIAGAKEDPAMMEQAFARVKQALAEGEVVGIFPEGKLTKDGEMNVFRPGIERIVAETGVPVVPLALRGLWGSFFSRSVDGQAFKRIRGFFNRIELVGGALVPAGDVTAFGLESTVKAMRGELR